ncbi:MAG TPA: SpoIIE family protein phosphatase [bacterium]|nr:SpoIIE family protein phosphatase [bacterium]
MMHGTLRLDELYSIVTELLATLTGSEGAVLLLHRPRTHHPVIFKIWTRTTDGPHDLPVGVGGELIGWLEARGTDPQPFATPLANIDAAIKAVAGDHVRVERWVPLIHHDHVFGAVAALVNEVNPGAKIDALLQPLAEQAAVALENALLFRRAERQSLENKSLLEASRILSSSLDLDEVLEKIMDSLNRVLPYDAGGIFLVGKDGQVEQIVARGYGAEAPARPESSLLERKARQGLVGWVAVNGQPLIVRDVTQDGRYQNARQQTRSEMVVPIFAGDRLVGVVNLERDIPNGFYEADLDLVTVFAQHAGMAIERARDHASVVEQRRIKGELEVAKSIQQTFLPDDNPRIPGFDIAGLNIPSAEVGGDYYDFIDIIDGQIGIAIADVAGKGVPAALIMATFRASLIAEIRNNYALRSIMQKVNRLLCERNERSRFVTAIYGVLDVRNRIFTFSNAGHNPGILCRADGTILMLKEGGTALGLFEDSVFEERAIGLLPGDLIFLYTDGVTDVVGFDGTMFEMNRLIDVLRANHGRSAEEIVARVRQAVDDFADPEQSRDDITMLAVRVQ